MTDYRIDDAEIAFYRHRGEFWENLPPDWEIAFDVDKEEK